MIKIYENIKNIDKTILFNRALSASGVEDIVTDIIKNVRTRGDEALFEYTERFDRAKLTSLEISKEEIAEALRETGEEFVGVLKRAAVNIESFHKRQVRNSFIINEKNGVVTGQKVTPLRRVGIYVPGGTAAYPSSVLMNAIPAKLAGVSEIVMVTPASGGKIAPAILAAASVAGVDRVFALGGAQAVAALAYGTESVPMVDKIVGPGNAFVAEAKRQVYGQVAIDMIAGPSEILVIADGNSSPAYVAADMLSQAEHDKNSTAVLITDSIDLAKKVSEQLEIMIEALPRRDIARASVDNNGKIIVTDDLVEAIELANDIAPEHLELCVDDPFAVLDRVKNAGSVFMGRYCPEALGDYFAGPNHTLPTSGTARFSSPLSVDDFVKKVQYTYFTKDALSEVADDVMTFAEKEGLSAHARSVGVRKKDI